MNNNLVRNLNHLKTILFPSVPTDSNLLGTVPFYSWAMPSRSS